MRSVNVHQFAMVPKADIPRSSFRMQTTHKTTFDAGYLIPVLCMEVLPGDTFNVRMTAFARLATPLFPVMDNLHLESFFFFCPNRLVWTNWQRFMGERDPDPDSSISYTVPQSVCPASGYTVGSLQDYFGMPTVGQIASGATHGHVNLPMRMYNLIWNEWFRDANLQDSVVVDKDDGPDTYSDYVLLRRGKRKDYFTGALPWPQKGDTAVSLPLGSTAPVQRHSTAPNIILSPSSETSDSDLRFINGDGSTYNMQFNNTGAGGGAVYWFGSYSDHTLTGLETDLSSATAATINQLREAFATQKLLERDARGGTRYTEIVRAHFGVISPDARLQRPEYLGGGSTPVIVSPIAQTSATGLTGGSTPMGNLAAMGTAVAGGHGFTQSFTEHGYVIGLVNVRADLTYQQGMAKHWWRSTRYDYYFPAFAMLGEQAILNGEIYRLGSGGSSDGLDGQVFGYQERWAEYRYLPSQISGLFRSTASGTIDPWHLAQEFTSRPVLDSTFIQDTPPVSRVVAVGAAANGQQFIFDSFFDVRAARPLPMYSVPGLIDHF